MGDGRQGVERDGQSEVVRCRRWSAEVEDAEVGVRGNGRDYGRVVGGESCAVSARMGGESQDRGGAIRGPLLELVEVKRWPCGIW